jgi:hypothetical protein
MSEEEEIEEQNLDINNIPIQEDQHQKRDLIREWKSNPQSCSIG